MASSEIKASVESQKADKKFVPFYGVNTNHITDALQINPNYQYSIENYVGYLYSGGTINMPSDCSVGIREVYYYNPSNVMVKITGTDTDGKYCEWGNKYDGSRWTGWQKNPQVTKASSIDVANIESDSTNLLSIHIEGDNGKYILAATSSLLRLLKWDTSVNNWTVVWDK